MKTKKTIEEYDENGNLIKRTIIKEEDNCNCDDCYYKKKVLEPWTNPDIPTWPRKDEADEHEYFDNIEVT